LFPEVKHTLTNEVFKCRKLLDRWIYVECDEDQHKGKTYSCERRRELELCNCAGILPVTFIRFNPDCFSTSTKSSRIKVRGESTARRHAAVVRAIKSAVTDVNPVGLTFVKLYFDCNCVGDGPTHACEFEHTLKYIDHEAFLLSFQ